MIQRKLCQLIAMSFLSVCCLVCVSYAEETEQTISIAILPCNDVVSTFKKFHLLTEYLKEQTGFETKIVVPKDPAEFERAVKAGNVQFALQGPHTYVRLAKWYHKDALISAQTWNGASDESGVIIVRNDSKIKKIGDLRGMTVMFGPRLSATKWLAAKWLFEENGMDIETDLRSYSNGGCCEDIAFNVYLKAVDAGVVCDHFMEIHQEKQDDIGIERERLIIIAKTGRVPTRVFAALRHVDKDIVSRVNESLLKLDKRQPAHLNILRPAEMSGFKPITDEEYDALRNVVEMED